MFQRLIDWNDPDFGDEAHEWIKILRQYKKLLEWQSRKSTQHKVQNEWEKYETQFPKTFIQLFDPKYIKDVYESSLTADQWFEKAYKSSSLDDQIKFYTNAINLKPNYSAAYNNRGAALDSLQRYDEAISDYSQAITLDPKYFAAYNNRGVSYFGKRNFDQAILDYNNAIILNPFYAEAFNNRGNVYFDRKEYTKAKSDYEEAIRFDKEYANAYFNLGQVYFNIKDFVNAKIYYEQALKFDPTIDLAQSHIYFIDNLA